MEDVVKLVTKLVSVEAMMQWLGNKLVEDYGVKDIEVKRVKDAVVLVVKGDQLDKVEKDMRKAVSGLGFGERVEIKVERE